MIQVRGRASDLVTLVGDIKFRNFGSARLLDPGSEWDTIDIVEVMECTLIDFALLN